MKIKITLDPLFYAFTLLIGIFSSCSNKETVSFLAPEQGILLYRCTHYSGQINNGKFETTSNNEFDIEVNVIRKNSGLFSEFTMLYPYKSDTGATVTDLILGKSISYERGLSVLYKLKATGELDHVVNWSQVKHYADSMSAIYLDLNGIIGDDRLTIDQIKAKLLTREHIERTLLKEFQLIQSLYGVELDVNNTNVIDNFPMDGVTMDTSTINIQTRNSERISILRSAKYTDAAISQILDNMLPTGFQNPFKPLADQNASIFDTCIFTFNLNKKCPETIFYWRTMKWNGPEFLEVIEIAKK